MRKCIHFFRNLGTRLTDINKTVYANKLPVSHPGNVKKTEAHSQFWEKIYKNHFIIRTDRVFKKNIINDKEIISGRLIMCKS